MSILEIKMGERIQAIEDKDKSDSLLEDTFYTRVLVDFEIGSMVKEITPQCWTKGISGKRYRVDYALLDKNFKIAIEIQSKEWHSEPWQIKRDIERAEDLKKAGWIVLFFIPEEIFNDTEEVATKIEETIEFNRNLESED